MGGIINKEYNNRATKIEYFLLLLRFIKFRPMNLWNGVKPSSVSELNAINKKSIRG